MKIKTQKINESLSINKIELENESKTNIVENGKNVIFAIDVSGSMYNELPKIRQQLKNKIPNLIGVNDTISIIWFSGKNQAGVLKEGVKVQNLIDVQNLNEAIDRFLVPIGLTAFLPPIEIAERVINNLSSNGNCFSFIFLSDGYNNDSSWDDVIKQLMSLEDKVDSSTFIEYGYYADSDALTEMSEIMGGEKIFSKDFDSYNVEFDKIISKKTAQRRVLDISSFKNNMLYQFLYSIDSKNETINVFSSKGKKQILIPQDVESVYFLTQKMIDTENSRFANCELLSSAFVLADRLRYTNVEDILLDVGDSYLINKFSGAYGKQKLNDLKDDLKVLAFNDEKLYSQGRVAKDFVIKQNAYCVMDLIKDLQNGDCYFYPYNKLFDYNRVTSKKVTKIVLTDDIKNELANAKSLSELNKITSDISAPEFIYPSDVENIGMSFNTLVWNQDRANLSVQTKLFGKVKLPKNSFNMSEVDSFIYRNFTLIKDGIVNVSRIPVKLDDKTHKKLNSLNLLDEENGYTILDISTLPTINRSMSVRPSAKKLAELEFDLIKLQVNQKYLKYLKDKFEVVNKTKYPDDVAEWLKSIGVTDNGFSPKVESVETSDFYISQVLKVKIEKTSTIPKISDFINKLENGKNLNVVELLLKNRYDEFNSKYKTHTLTNVLDELTIVDKARREYLIEIAKIKFGIILSRSWFKEFTSLSDNEILIKFDEVDTQLKVLFDYKDEQVKI